MAQNIDNKDNQLVEQLFQSIDTIATKRLEGIQFNKTLKCQIIDASNSAEGEYLVVHEGAEFFAYSENETYSEGTWVYVIVPNGNMDNQKIIIGKYTEDSDEYYTYRDPFDSFLDITGNLIDGEVDPDNEVGITANGDEIEVVIWETGIISTQPYASNQMSNAEVKLYLQNEIDKINENYEQAKQLYIALYGEGTDEYNNAKNALDEELEEDLQELIESQNSLKTLNDVIPDTVRRLSQFDRLGIRASFRTLLSQYGLVSGHFGLKLNIITRDPASTSVETIYTHNILEFDSDQMFGNPYKFVSWSQQQTVFDLSDFEDIIGLQLILYQKQDFKDENYNFIPGYAQLPTTIPEEGTQAYEEYLELQHLWDLYYAVKNIFVKDIYISLGYSLDEFKEDTLFLFSFEPLTYASYLTDTSRQIIEGLKPNLNLNIEKDTQEALKIINEKNIHLRWIHYDTNGNLLAVENIDDLPTWENYDTEEILPMAKIHWYRWTMEDGIEDELAGAFWKELNIDDIIARQNAPEGTDFSEWIEVPNEYAAFEYPSFYPDPMEQMEQLKVIIEYPTRDYIRYEYQNAIEQDLEDKNTEILQNAINECFPNGVYDSNNIYHRTLIAVTCNRLTEEERGKLEVEYLQQCSLYTSPEITFTNEHDTPDGESIELIRGLQLVCDADGLNGIYRIYNADGKIINSSEAKQKRIIAAQFDTLVTGNEELDSAETIRWYFPVNQTMIEAPTDGCEYYVYKEPELLTATSTQADVEAYEKQVAQNESSICAVSAGLTDDGQWFCIERQGVQRSARAAGSIVPTQLEQIFRVKDYYTQTAINNTIKCEVYKNNRTYSTEYTLHFSTSGSTGTDYTLTVSFEEETADGSNEWKPLTTPAIDWHGNRIRIVPSLYDYENNKVENATFSYGWESPSSNNNGVLKIENQNIITRDNTATNRTQFYHYILRVSSPVQIKVKATNGTDNTTIKNNDTAKTYNVDVTTYYPIPIRFDNTYVGLDGDGRVTYDTSGTNPIYYKNNYTLYKLNNQNIPTAVATGNNGVTWSIVLGESGAITQYYPQIDANTGKLIVPSMYMATNDSRVSIVAIVGGQPVWCQPLYISQDVYASAFLNSWDGGLSIDNQRGTIMSVMMGAGYKDNQNKFNGVLMGNVGKGADVGTSSLTGLYGYNAGQQSFGFNIDGKAFIGKAGRGQIKFDGNNGEIFSASWHSAQGYDDSGMRIDLDDAYMDFRGKKTGNNRATVHIGISGTAKEDTQYFYIQDKNSKSLIEISDTAEYIQSANWNNNNTGIKFDLLNNKLTGYDFKLEAISSSSDAGVTLSSTTPYIIVKATNGTRILYVGEDNYYLQSSNYSNGSTGVKFDLLNNKLQAYDFDIKALSSTNNAGVTISSTNPYITIKASNGITILYAGENNYYLQSPDFSNGSAGIKFDLLKNKLQAYNFEIKATSSNGNIIIDSGASQIPFKIGSNFSVAWDGTITASKGTIGGFQIDDNNLVDTLDELETDMGDARNYADNYLYYSVNTGLTVAASNPASATSCYTRITSTGIYNVLNSANWSLLDSSGLTITQNGSQVAQFGSAIYLGAESSAIYLGAEGQDHITITNAQITFYHYYSNAGAPYICLQNFNDAYGGGILINGGESKMLKLVGSVEFTSDVWGITDLDCGNIYCGAIDTFGKSITCGTIYSTTLYMTTPGSSTAGANARIMDIPEGGSYHHLGLANQNSSKRYKHDIDYIKESSLNPSHLYDIEVVQFKYNDDYLEKKDQRRDTLMPGFIAEQVAEVYPIAVDLDIKDRPQNWNERFIIPPMLALIQEQHKEIEELKQQVQQLIINK